MKYIYLIFGISIILSCTKTKLVQKDNTIIVKPSLDSNQTEKLAPLSIGKNEILLNEFKAFCIENSISNQDNFDALLKDFLKIKLLSIEAKKLGYANDQIYLEELSSYKEILSKDYLIDSSFLEKLKIQTIERFKQERKISHILFKLSEFASPDDTLRIYLKALEVNRQANLGTSFYELSKKYSEDTNTNKIGGQLGWFTALQLQYPIENTAFQQTVETVSLPIRSPAGYHIIKVNEIRPNSGTVSIKYLACLKSKSNSDSLSLKFRIDSLSNIITNNKTFEETYLNLKNSKDNLASGEINNFGVGEKEDILFEQARFKVNEGDFSKPFYTSTGWFIIKVEKKNPPLTTEKYLEKISDKLNTDSRGKEIEKNSLVKTKNYLNFQNDEEGVAKLLSTNFENLNIRKWQKTADYSDYKLFDIDSKNIFSNEFYDFLIEKQSFEKFPSNSNSYEINKYFLDKFIEKTVYERAKNKLEEKNTEFKFLINNQANRMLSQKLYNEKVLEKSITDTTGLRNLYNDMINEFKVPENAKTLKIVFKDSTLKNEFLNTINSGKPYNLKRGILPIYFQKNSFKLEDKDFRRLAGLQLILDKYPNYIVEIGGHRDVNEESNISSLRIQEVSKQLEKLGIKIMRTSELDYQDNKLANKFDWTKNQRISFQFFTNEIVDVAESFLEKKPALVEIKNETIEKQVILNLNNAIEWKEGIYELNDKSVFLVIQKINEARIKSIKETKGQLIKIYQSKLEKQLFDELTVKYPIELNKEGLLNIYSELIQKN